MPLNKPKALLILNPRAGKQNGKKYFFDIVSILSQKYSLTLHLTEYAGDAADTAANADEFDTVICCGGDGTVGQVLDGVSRLSHPVDIGYIPCGTTNDLATATGIPKDIRQAAEAVLVGKPIAHDVGLFGTSRRFVYTATFGAFAQTSFSTPQDLKNLFGHFAYLLSGVTELANLRKYSVRIRYDKGTMDADDVLLCSVLNTTSIGGILKLPKDQVDFADGLFEVLIIRKPKNVVELGMLAQGLLSGDYENVSGLTFLKTSVLSIQTEEAVSWTIDGEDAGIHTSVRIQCLKCAANFIRIIDNETPLLTTKE